MVEQVLQQSPAYFKRFAKYFRYVVSEEYPILPENNFALAFHNPKSDFCALTKNELHFHLLIYTGKNVETYGSTVTCPYSAFKLLILDGINTQFHGDIFDRLETAIKYNDKYEVGDTRPDVLRKKLPKIVTSSKMHVATQTDISSESLNRFLSVLKGPYSGEFSQIMDCFLSGYGTVSMQTHSMLTKFSLECAPAQCYCYECSNY